MTSHLKFTFTESVQLRRHAHNIIHTEKLWKSCYSQFLGRKKQQLFYGTAAVPELLKDQPHQPPKQSCAEDHTEQIEAAIEETHC